MNNPEAEEILALFDQVGEGGSPEEALEVAQALGQHNERRRNIYDPINKEVERVMELFSERAGGYGVEVYQTHHEVLPEEQIFYVNMGDVYDLTLVYQNGLLQLTTLGDVMENSASVYERKKMSKKMNESVDNEEMKEQLIADLWDLGKDLYDVKPRWINFEAMSLDELNELYEEWIEELQEKMSVERASEEKADAEIEATIRKLEKTGLTREEAIVELLSLFSDEIDVSEPYYLEVDLHRGLGISWQKAQEFKPIMLAALGQRGLDDLDLEDELDLMDEYEDLYAAPKKIRNPRRGRE
jgi:hypothetical protein